MIMHRIEEYLRSAAFEAALELWKEPISEDQLQIQKTRKDFDGEFTIVVFPLLRISRNNPEETARMLGQALLSKSEILESYNVIKGFLNLTVRDHYWISLLKNEFQDPAYGMKTRGTDPPKVMIEFSSPNTNKPLHLGHIRNNLLGYSVAKILEASGHMVRKVNLVNDRGIHICKSMLAWQEMGKGETPETSGRKGDHLVGEYYVKFDQTYKRQVEALEKKGMDRMEAESRAPFMQKARAMLREWEAGDPDIRALWEKMNQWVYAGFEETYRRLGIRFDKTYYESDTYKLGREIVLKGLKEGILYKKEDGSVWVDLESEGLDHKLLLRSDGTSVYMTQDIGTAHQRYGEFAFGTHIYVVGNEQNYHFQVLALILDKLGYHWAKDLFHLSYGMVELPEGKMKSREGTVVDADDLMDEMERTARQMSEELGKLEANTQEEKKEIYRKVGMGALKYFILKVDPKKNMTFDPRESVDFNGNTGPFIQYTYARIQSVIRKGSDLRENMTAEVLNDKEKILAHLLYEYPGIISDAAATYNPSLIANYLYELAKEFNQFYHDHSILGAESQGQVELRLLLTTAIGGVIGSGMNLLGIEVPDRM